MALSTCYEHSPIKAEAVRLDMVVGDQGLSNFGKTLSLNNAENTEEMVAFGDCEKRSEQLSSLPGNMRLLGSMRFTQSRSTKIKGADSAQEILRLHDLTSQYVVVRENLGQGHFGVVHEVKHERTGKRFALKTITFKDSNTLKNNSAMQAEIASSADFDHPYIIKLHGFFLEDNRYHLLMDLCTGGNLRDYLMRMVATVRGFQPDFASGLPAATVSKFLYQMLSGIMFLHHWGYVHRDIKPDNYLIADETYDPCLKLSDFGLSCRISRGEVLTSGVGTARYLAPEVILGAYTEKCDMWSAGVTAYMLATFAYPFWGDTTEDYLKNVSAGNFAVNPKGWRPHPARLKDVIMRMLTLDPNDRPSAKFLIAETPFLSSLHRDAERHTGKGCCTIS